MPQDWQDEFISGLKKYIQRHVAEFFNEIESSENIKVKTSGSINFYKFSAIQVFDIYYNGKAINRIFAKAHRNPRFENLRDSVLAPDAVDYGKTEFEFHKKTWRTFKDLYSEYAVARPLKYVEEFNTILIEKAAGISLSEFIGGLPSKMESETKKEAGLFLQRCGKWLHILHNEFEKHAAEKFNPEEYRNKIDREINKFRKSRKADLKIKEIVKRMDKLLPNFEGKEVSRAKIHGDFKSRHIFVAPEKITLIDFGNDLAISSPFMDVAAFVVELESLTFASIRKSFIKWQEVLVNDFYTGYFRDQNISWELDMYLVYYWLKKWYRRRQKFSHSYVLKKMADISEKIRLMELLHKMYTDPWFFKKIATSLNRLEQNIEWDQIRDGKINMEHT